MKKTEVPQDDTPTYRGYSTKVMYAVDEAGRYTTVPSSGWEVEEIVLRDVVEDFKEKAKEARKQAIEGNISPLAYFMNKRLMDLPALAAGVGFSTRRVKRHMNPRVFRKLSGDILSRYAAFFRIEVEMLTHFKEKTGAESTD